MEKTLKFEIQPYQKSIEFLINQEGNINIEIEDDWHGDSETGFGARLYISISKKQKETLIKFLKEE